METKVFIISMVLCGEMISYTSTTPINDINAVVKEGATLSGVTIKTA